MDLKAETTKDKLRDNMRCPSPLWNKICEAVHYDIRSRAIGRMRFSHTKQDQIHIVKNMIEDKVREIAKLWT